MWWTYTITVHNLQLVLPDPVKLVPCCIIPTASGTVMNGCRMYLDHYCHRKFEVTLLRATPLRCLRHLRCALRRTCSTPAARTRNDPNSKQGNSLLLDSLLFHTPPLCIVQYVPWGLFFLFFLSPPPPPANPWVLGLGVGVMGNAGLLSRSAHGQWLPSLLPLHFDAFEGVSKIS